MTVSNGGKKFKHKLALSPGDRDNLKLGNGDRVAVIGSGPSGSFFSFFVLELAERAGLDISVDIYDNKDFSRCGPAGCNHCGGIVSESLVQILAAEGINIPTNVAQRGIGSYILHMDVGSVKIETSVHEKRIAAMFRGAGPLGSKDVTHGSFDGYLQELAVKRGARYVKDRVKSIAFDDTGCPSVKTKEGMSQTYNLLVGAVGVSASALKLFKVLEFGYQPPHTTKTFICEFFSGPGNGPEIFREFNACVPAQHTTAGICSACTQR